MYSLNNVLKKKWKSFFGFNSGNFLDNSDGNGLFHISDGESS